MISSFYRKHCIRSGYGLFNHVSSFSSEIPSALFVQKPTDGSETSPEILPKNTQRLSKYIAQTGICSRREAEKRIKMGRVLVNGALCTSINTAVVTEDIQTVVVDGIKIKASNQVLVKPKLWAVYKNRGELAADHDPKSRPLLLDRVRDSIQLDRGDELQIVSRLDFNTEGICLLTNNGVLARILEGEHADFARYYRARVHGLLTEDKLLGIRKGVFINGKRQTPMSIEVERSVSSSSWLKISMKGKRNRNVSEVLKQVYIDIARLICVGFGPFKLNAIPPQGWIELKIPSNIENLFYEMSVHNKIVKVKK